jgi:hypothetical protein
MSMKENLARKVVKKHLEEKLFSGNKLQRHRNDGDVRKALRVLDKIDKQKEKQAVRQGKSTHS